MSESDEREPRPGWPGWTGWTGGQYSLTRALFGFYLSLHFLALALGDTAAAVAQAPAPEGALLRLFPNVFGLWSDAGFVNATLVAAALASVLFALGWQRRALALALGYLAACVYLRDPLSSARCLPYLILLHAALPPAPFGSLAARGRTDPGGGWRMPNDVFTVAWFLLAFGYAFDGVTRLGAASGAAWRDGSALAQELAGPLGRVGLSDALLLLPDAVLSLATWTLLGLQLAFLPLALVSRTRPFAWSALFGVHVLALVVMRSADASLAMLFLHLFTFDPSWVRARAAATPEKIFYDGQCGLCHRWVRFVLAEDHGSAFHFAPLDSQAFQDTVPPGEREDLPDSIVVQRADGELLVRSDAALHILRGLGGLWTASAALLGLVPRSLRDGAYDTVARVRRRLFKAPADACPLMPPELGARFHA